MRFGDLADQDLTVGHWKGCAFQGNYPYSSIHSRWLGQADAANQVFIARVRIHRVPKWIGGQPGNLVRALLICPFQVANRLIPVVEASIDLRHEIEIDI